MMEDLAMMEDGEEDHHQQDMVGVTMAGEKEERTGDLKADTTKKPHGSL